MKPDYLNNKEVTTHFDYLIKKFTSLVDIENIELREIMDDAQNKNS